MSDYKYVSEHNLLGYQRSWNQKPLEWQGNRVIGRTSVGHLRGIDWTRHRENRLGRLQAMLREQGVSAMLLTMGENVNYATGTSDYNWKGSNGTLYALMFADPDKAPILYETVGPDTEIVKMHCPWIDANHLRPAITYKMTGSAYKHQLDRYIQQIKDALVENGISPTADLAVDSMDFSTYLAFKEAGMNIISVGDALTEVRCTKSADEIELIKVASAITQAAFWKMKNEWVKPGVTEREVVAKAVEFYIANGMTSWGVIVASGSNTNPLHRMWSDKIIQQGDMVIIDIGVPSYQGYGIDVTRCWPVEAPFTPKQKEVYKQCYNATYAAINKIKPGNTTADVAAQFPPDMVDVHGTCDMLQVAHSVGMGFYEGYWMNRGFSLDYPMPIKKNMVIACETYVASPEGPAARLEDTVVVTDDGYELLSFVPFEKEALE